MRSSRRARPEFAARFGGRQAAGHEHEAGEADEDLAFVEFVGADALLQGVEAHADVQLTARLAAEVGVDYVRGTLRTTAIRCRACRRCAAASACAISATRSRRAAK